MNHKSQITIFIIIALIITASIILYFVLFYKIEPEISMPTIKSPDLYIEKCAKDAANKAIETIMLQGGYVEPTNYKLYQDNKIEYLCYTNMFYKTCTMQEPLYIKHLENEITNYIRPEIEKCFSTLKAELEKENYQIEISEMNLKTELMTNLVRIKIDRIFNMKKQEESRRFESFRTDLNSPLYSLAIIAQEIASEEAKFCYFESLGFMIFYPKFGIDRKAVGSGTDASRIYIIQDRNTGKKLNIAIRSCAIPAGF